MARKSVKPVEAGPEEEPVVKKPEVKLSWVDAMGHLFKSIFHASIVAMPHLYVPLGFLVASLMIVGQVVVYTYAINILVRAAQKLCRDSGAAGSLSYPEAAGQAVLSRFPERKGLALAAKVTVCTVLVIGLVTCICSCVMNSAAYMKRATFDTILNTHILVFLLIMLTTCLLVSCCVPNLLLVTPFSWIGTFMLATGAALITFFCFYPMPELSETISEDNIPMHWTHIFHFVTFPMQSIMVILTIENEMQNPEKLVGWASLTTLVMALVTVCSVYFGILGYLRFGFALSSNIIYEIPVDSLMLAIRGLFAFGLCFQVVLYFYALASVVQRSIEAGLPEVRGRLLIILTRCACFVLCFLLTYIFAGFALALVVPGSVALCLLTLFFPPVIDMLVRHEDPGRFYWRYVLDVLLICCCPLVLSGSLYAAYHMELSDVRTFGFSCDYYCVVSYETLKHLKFT